jgi:UDP-glucuronate decarboxylase
MYGTEIKVMRIFNTYGPQMAEGDGRVMSNIIVQALRGEPLTIYADRYPDKELFANVSDLVRGMIMLMAAGPEARLPINYAIRKKSPYVPCRKSNSCGQAASPQIVFLQTLPP